MFILFSVFHGFIKTYVILLINIEQQEVHIIIVCLGIIQFGDSKTPIKRININLNLIFTNYSITRFVPKIQFIKQNYSYYILMISFNYFLAIYIINLHHEMIGNHISYKHHDDYLTIIISGKTDSWKVNLILLWLIVRLCIGFQCFIIVFSQIYLMVNVGMPLHLLHFVFISFTGLLEFICGENMV